MAQPRFCRLCRTTHDPLWTCTRARNVASVTKTEPVCNAVEHVGNGVGNAPVIGNAWTRWRDKNREDYNRSQRFKMQLRRAVKSGRACLVGPQKEA